MKKIITAFDGLKYSKCAESYALFLAKQTNAHMVGVFMDDPIYTSYKISDVMVKGNVSNELIKEHEDKDKATRKLATDNFEKSCQKEKLEYSIHHDKNIALIGLLHESIYADLLVIDSKETLTHYTEKIPTRFIRELLTDVQCPTLIVPQRYKPIQKLILLYDGSPSSVYAIKMFSYLLPQMKHLDTEVLSVNPTDSYMHLKDNKLIKEFLKRHFPKAKFIVTRGLVEDEIIKYLKNDQANALVIMGAYRRGAVSRWFRESMADVLMKEVKLPLFIAHYK
ncbi:universal stress protein [Panacibacter ginsenosidivorans]|uniref:Universal stress protein n=1 Tax=Panacibacter ginsenosidivorans TaxID=1813871 RepID=A0A5B8V4E6_9BACT|nr:universal stress protein [Panacibacter ginsenosidivorans]QEC66250.1 universal stress protein [Panacibacter ginsenosidivorans]